MNEFSDRMKTVLWLTLSFLLVCVIVWLVIPNVREWVAGLFLGTIFSMVNAFMLTMKIQLIAHQAMQGVTKRVHAGFISRASVCIIAVMIALKLQQFELITTIIGLFTTQIALYVVSLVYLLKQNVRTNE